MRRNHETVRLAPVPDREPRQARTQGAHINAAIDRGLHERALGRRAAEREHRAGSGDVGFAAQRADLEQALENGIGPEIRFVVGNAHRLKASLLAPGTTISATLANEFAEAKDEMHVSALFALGLILFVITFLVLAAAKLMLARLEQRAAK